MKTILTLMCLAGAAICYGQDHSSQLDPYPLADSDQSISTEEQDFLNFRMANVGQKTMSTYVIPVVVHVVHNFGAENISDQEIQETIENLNQRFNGDYGGADTDVEFKLATIDPDGDCTNGITRTQFNQPNVTDNDSHPGYVSPQTIRGLINWPQDRYMNIWVVRNVRGYRNNFDSNNFAYEVFQDVGSQVTRVGRPQWSPENDGIIISYANFGGGTFHGMDSEALLTRDAGRYLNLINVWGDGSVVAGCCDLDEASSTSWVTRDLINDTPPCNYYGGNTVLGFDDLMIEIASCGNETNCFFNNSCDEYPDADDYFPKQNYMSYNLNCMNEFTNGQAEWMWNSIDFFRSNLVSLANLMSTGVVNSISANAVWNNEDFVDGNVFVGQSITVPSGSELEINEGVTVHFARDAKLVIEKGGKVTINGATLTNFCEGLWEGIEVQGQSDLDQSPTSNQGYLRIKNDAVIENAECAVRLAKNNTIEGWNIDWSRTGGIVRASDATFKNNVKDVEFLSYHNINNNNSILYNNTSYFRDCNFIVDFPLNDDSDYLNERVSLFDVEGISFSKCRFAVEGWGLMYYSPTERGTGILASKAGFSVTGGCSAPFQLDSECESSDLTAQLLDDPSSDFIPSSFENFRTGIKATDPLEGPPVKITQTIFDNNEFGLQLANMKSTTLRRNKFLIREGQWITYGAQFSGCSEYTIERNVFNSIANNPNAANFGLNIINSGDQEHEVYLNDFDGVLAGIIVQQQNQNHNTENGGNDSDIGLELRCNDFNNTTYDIALTNDASIANLQGDYVTYVDDYAAPAGNVFEPLNVGNERDVFVSDDSEWFVYLHHDEGNDNNPYVKPESIELEDVLNVPQTGTNYTTRDEVCPINGSGFLSAADKKSIVVEKRSLIEALKLDLNSTVDGGNSDMLLNVLNSGNFTDTEIRNVLQEISPFLSNAILTECIQKDDPLNVWVLCEILLANSPLHYSVIEIYEEELPLPEHLDHLFWLYQSGTSAVGVKKSQIKAETRSKERAMNAYTEEVAFSEDSEVNEKRKEILETEESNRKIRSLVAIYLQEGKESEANSLLDSYAPIEENDNYKQYTQFYLGLDKSEGYSHVSEDQITTIRGYAEGSGTMRIAAAAF